MKSLQLWLRASLMVMLVASGGASTAVQAASPPAVSPSTADPVAASQYALSPAWDGSIQRWATHIESLARANRMSPDLIAAVIRAESNGDPTAVSYAGAVGLMGIMPSERGFSNRPPTETLLDAGNNLRWGVGILAEILRQSGGDLPAALAAYNGGWHQVDSLVPRAYAAGVLDEYGRAIAARAGVSPDIASRWTVALEIHGGNIPPEPLLIGAVPLSGFYRYGEHIVYSHVTERGQAYYVKGYAVPVALLVPVDNAGRVVAANPMPDVIARQLTIIGQDKIRQGNPRILLACLPSIARLRGRVNSRWFAPSACPAWQR